MKILVANLGSTSFKYRLFDMDGPREGDDGFDAIGGNLDLAVDDYLAHNVNYLRVILGVKLPPLD